MGQGLILEKTLEVPFWKIRVYSTWRHPWLSAVSLLPPGTHIPQSENSVLRTYHGGGGCCPKLATCQGEEDHFSHRLSHGWSLGSLDPKKAELRQREGNLVAVFHFLRRVTAPSCPQGGKRHSQHLSPNSQLLKGTALNHVL